MQVAHGSQSDLTISAASMDSVPNFWVNSIQNLVNLQLSLTKGITFTKSLDLLKFSPNSNIVGVQLESLFEFIDIDNNNIFDPSIDTVVKIYDLDRPWNQISTNKSQVIGGSNVGVTQFTTSDGVFSFRGEISDDVDAPLPVDSNAVLRTNNGARVVIGVNKFNFASPTNKLAIKVVVLAPAMQHAQNGFNQYKNHISIGSDKAYKQLGYFLWNTMGMVAGKDSTLTSTNFYSSQNSKANYESDISFGVGKSVLMNSQNSPSKFSVGEAQVVYFSPDIQAPSNLFW